MAFPVTLNGRTYTLADFSGTAYVDGFPDALEDFVTHAGNTYLTTSTTSTTLGTGSKTFTVADSGKPYASGTPLRISSSADETDFMDGLVTSYSGTTLTVNVVGFSGSGTLASWNINIGGGPITVSGTLPINQGGTGATTASAAASALGVGTEDSPTFTGLTVTGTANFSDIDLSNVGDIALDSISSDSGGAIQVTLGTDAGDDFKVNNGSDVLLVEGDTSAVTIAGELTVKDIVMSDADTPKITMTDTTNTLTTFIQSGNSSSIIGTSTSHPLRLQTNSTDAIYVDTSQNVGIGLTDPDTPLEVQIGSSGNALKLSSSADGASVFLAFEQQESGTKHVRGRIRAASNGVDGGLIFETGASSSTSERMRIDSSGNVGLGTSSPNSYAGFTVLTLNNTNGADIDFEKNGTVQGSIFTPASADDLTITAAHASGDLVFQAGGFTERMRINSSGSVGINTNSMHDFGANNHEFQINGVKGGSVAFSRGTNGATEQHSLRTSDDDALRFERGSNYASESMRIDSSGNLLVGTTTSGGSGGVTLRSDGVMVAPAVYGTVVSASLRDIQMDSSGFFGYSTSTRATKGNIENLSDVSWLYSLNPVSFNRKVNGEELSPELEYGLIAEDVEEVNAELCFYNETDNGQELAGITYSKLITPLLKALQEANERIETLEAKVTALENA